MKSELTASRRPGEDSPATSSPAHAPCVFVVEDDADLRDVLSLVLRSHGLRVESFATADGFLRGYDPHRPGCILLDVHLPGMTGIELHQHLAKREPKPSVLFLTGQASVPQALAAMRTGAVDFLEKPFHAALLLSRIEEALARDCEQRRLHAERQALEARRAGLTPRERQVMELLATGQSTKVIAARFGISPKTVDKHRARILAKMGVDNPIELARTLWGRAPDRQSTSTATDQGAPEAASAHARLSGM